MACGACHLMSGLGHPESSDLTGLTVPYMVQQMIDFKSGVRKDPTGKRMNGIAAAVTDAQVLEAAEYFAKLPRKSFQKVVETNMVQKSYLANGRMRFLDPAGAMEPIAGRIITVPEDPVRARTRDPNSGFISYVPVGSIARGKELVETGAGRTMACGLCHGLDMKGQGANPRLAGMHPIYTYRQLAWFKDGTRKGIDASFMVAPVARLDQRRDGRDLGIPGYARAIAFRSGACLSTLEGGAGHPAPPCFRSPVSRILRQLYRAANQLKHFRVVRSGRLQPAFAVRLKADAYALRRIGGRCTGAQRHKKSPPSCEGGLNRHDALKLPVH